MSIVTIGLDLAKTIFQIHAVDEIGNVILRKRLTRSQVLPTLKKIDPCLVGMEACSSSHHWAREIEALGHEVKLMPAQYVKPYVKRNKTDAADAEAICEAVRRPTMRFVPIKSREQQAVLLQHRSRELLVKQRTMLVNAVRSYCMEFGLVMAKGIHNVSKLKQAVGQMSLPKAATDVLGLMFTQLEAMNEKIDTLEERIHAWHRQNESSKRLTRIPGVGPLTASAIVASIGDATCFGSSRSFAAWLGLTPRECSSGGKRVQGGISKRGDGYIRRLLVHGGRAVVRVRCQGQSAPSPWLDGLLANKHRNTVAVAVANKNARVIWALLTTGKAFGDHVRQAQAA